VASINHRPRFANEAGSMPRLNWVRYLAVLLLAPLFMASAMLNAATLDTLLVVDSQGRISQTQHTLSSNGELLVLELPENARFPYAHFMGPEDESFTYAFSQNPGRIALWSGSAIVRHGSSHEFHGESNEAAQAAIQNELTLPGYLEALDVENGELSQWRLTLVFTSNVRPIDWTTTDASSTWTLSGNTLSWHQPHGRMIPLSISLASSTDQANTDQNDCQDSDSSSADCSPDLDQDGVPDHRDLCLDPSDKAANNKATSPSATELEQTSSVDEFGCKAALPLRLYGVEFQAGQNYLNIGSRRILDRLAAALLHLPERRYQVGAHTDSEGSDAHNRALSKARAQSVRQYLILRGLKADRLQAAGYGEDYPLRDNSSIEGRRKNRRVELKRLD